MRTIRFETEAEFGAFFAMLHYGVVLSANLHRDRTLVDVEREARLDELLEGISDRDGRPEFTPAGTHLRQLKADGARQVLVDGDTLAMIDKYIRYAAERCAPDFARPAAVALRVVRRAAEAPA